MAPKGGQDQMADKGYSGKGKRRFGKGFARAGGLVQPQIRKASESRGFAVSRLVTHWAEVVGDDIAALCRPVKVGYGRQGGLGATLTVLARGAVGRSYNIGGENEARNIDLVRMICALMDEMVPGGAPHDRLITFVTDRPGHDLRYAIDPARMRGELGWRPSVTLEEGLRRTVRWYLDNPDWWRALQDRDGVGRRLGVKA